MAFGDRLQNITDTVTDWSEGVSDWAEGLWPDDETPSEEVTASVTEEQVTDTGEQAEIDWALVIGAGALIVGLISLVRR